MPVARARFVDDARWAAARARRGCVREPGGRRSGVVAITLTGLLLGGAQLRAAGAGIGGDLFFGGDERFARENLQALVLAETLFHDAVFERMKTDRRRRARPRASVRRRRLNSSRSASEFVVDGDAQALETRALPDESFRAVPGGASMPADHARRTPCVVVGKRARQCGVATITRAMLRAARSWP